MNPTDRVLGILAGVLVLLGLGGLGARIEPPAAGMALSSLATSGIFVVLAFGLAGFGRDAAAGERAQLGLVRSRVAAGITLALACGTLGLSNVAETLIRLLEADRSGTLAEISEALAGARGPGLALAVLSIGLVAGVAEEIFFRGLVQQTLARRLANVRGGGALAVTLSSALFATAHWDPAHSAAAFVLGLYLGTVAQLTGSIRPAIACHVLNNLAAVVGTSFGVELPARMDVLMALQLATPAAALLLAWRLRRPAPKPVQKAGEETFPGGGRL